MEKLNLGVLGFGQRGMSMLKSVILEMDSVTVTAVGDLYEDSTTSAADAVEEKTGKRPFATQNPSEVINRPDVDAVLVFTGWESHIPLAIEAMKAGKPVGVEVGGAYSVEQCWDLVHTYEETGTPVMMLENCCFGRRELMVLNMVKEGLFGKIVHCDGGYCHDLRDEVSGGIVNRHYRLRNYTLRNCENYPTHELGPIAKILDINHGNRFVKLNSVASGAFGLHEYIAKNMPDDPLLNRRFAQGDVVTTVITCAGGQTVRITLDTTLPRPYSRQFTVHGTKGIYQEDNDSFFFDGDGDHFEWKSHWGNASEYAEKYDHPIWKEFIASGVRGGHGGMDWLTCNHFADCVINGKPFYVDAYDMATWMCVTALSEISIVNSGAPVDFPDFTNGKWILNENKTVL